MELEIKKDLASNWFKTSRCFCDDISKFENNKINSNHTLEKKSKKDEGGGEYRILKMEKFLIKLE